MRILVLIVTYNSNLVIRQTLEAVFHQLRPQDAVVLVNNGKTDVPHFNPDELPCLFLTHQATENLGFCGGNNLGLKLGNWQLFDAVLLLNPDLVLPANWIEKATAYLASHSSDKIGILSGPLISYDFKNKCPLPRIDSLGIGRNRLPGLWKDIGQGDAFSGDLNSLIFSAEPEAICGALMLIPRAVVLSVAADGQLFDERFWSYKEDLDLSFRVHDAGWRLIVERELFAYHGRGWSRERNKVPYHLRLQSARNELLLHWKSRKLYLLMSLAKLFYVRWLEKK